MRWLKRPRIKGFIYFPFLSMKLLLIYLFRPIWCVWNNIVQQQTQILLCWVLTTTKKMREENSKSNQGENSEVDQNRPGAVAHTYIPALWVWRLVDHLRSGVWNQPGQYGETPTLLKNTKISWPWWAHICSPSYLGGWGRRITWMQETEVAVSRDHATVLQPER